MSDFVQQCRKEWKRLGVPDPVAEEMASDLAADLAEAEADGLSAEELLGSGAFDPRSFAAAWAAERGVIPRPPSGRTLRRGPLVMIAFAVLAALTVIVAASSVLQSRPGVALIDIQRAPHLVPPPSADLRSGPTEQVIHRNTSVPSVAILLVLTLVVLGFCVWLWSIGRRSRPPGATA